MSVALMIMLVCYGSDCAVYWQLLTEEHMGICTVIANGQRLTPERWNIAAKGELGA